MGNENTSDLPKQLPRIEVNSWDLSGVKDVRQDLAFPRIPAFAGVLQLAENNIDGEGLKIVVIDPDTESDFFLPSGITVPRKPLHGFGIASIIKIVLPKSQVILRQSADSIDEETIIGQIQAATREGANVINLSMGKNINVGDDDYHARLTQAIKEANVNGVTVIAACSYADRVNKVQAFDNVPEVIMVGGLTRGLEPINTPEGARIDMFAPGEAVPYSRGHSYLDHGNGHSFAAPFITIAAAVLRTKFPHEQIRQILLDSISDVNGHPFINWGKIIQHLTA